MARMINGFLIVTRQVAATRGAAGPQAVDRAFAVPRYINPVPAINGIRQFERAAQDNASQELLQQAALAVLGRWVPGLGWLLLFNDIYQYYYATKPVAWVDDCRTGSGENVGVTTWCIARGEDTQASYYAKKNKPVYMGGVWRMAEYANVRDPLPGWPGWVDFQVVAQKHVAGEPDTPPVGVTYVPELPLFGPDPYYKWPAFVDPVTLPINQPVPDPVPPPYDFIPHRQPNPERVEQTERGYAFRRQYDANYMPDTLPVSDILSNPFGSAVFAPATGRRGIEYSQRVAHGHVGVTHAKNPDVQTDPAVVPGFGGNPSGSPGVAPPVSRSDPRTTKERKHKLSVGGRPAALIGGFTESLDFLDVLYRSLPGKYNLTKKCRKKRLGVVKKARLVWDKFDEVQMDKFIVNFTNNQIEDLIFGKAGRGAAVGMRNMRQGHGMQFGTSNNRRVKGDVDSEVGKVARKNDAFDAAECRRLKSG